MAVWSDTIVVPKESWSSSTHGELHRPNQWRSGLGWVVGQVDFAPGQGLAIRSLKKRKQQPVPGQRALQAGCSAPREMMDEEEEESKKKAHVNDERRASVVLAGRPSLLQATLAQETSREEESTTSSESVEALVVPDDRLLHWIKQGDWSSLEDFAAQNRSHPAQRLQINPNCTDGLAPALFYASEGGHEEFVSLLLENGADVDAKNESGVTPLFIAAQVGAANIVRLLMDHGADPYLRSTRDQVLPLYVACFEGHLDVVKELLLYHNLKEREEQASGSEQHISMVNAVGVGTDGNTPLMACCERGHMEIAEFLLAHGAEKDARGKAGETALFWAVQEGFLGLVQLLVQKGSDVNTQKNDGATPLFMAVLGGDTRMVALLITLGAQNDIATHNGETPLVIARRMGRRDMVEWLLVSPPS